jgi:chemotaxis protein MotB
MAKNTGTTIIVKKARRGGHGGGHHGGAWKVAYADFVTAMMAFFLLLWLLNVTTDVQKRGIADYFEPTISSRSMSGAGGVLGGLTVGSPGSQQVPLSKPSFTLDRPGLRQPYEGDDGDEGGGTGKDRSSDQDNGTPANAANAANAEANGGKVDEATTERKLAEREEKRFAAAEHALHEALEQVPELKDLAQNLLVDRTPEGLRIQLIDQAQSPMFPLGSTDMAEPARKLMSLVTQVIQRLPNKLSITGHTDSTPYAGARHYTNWELSTDRANASRREFIADGLPPDRVARVVGMADQQPLVPGDAASPRNRRISVVLLREAKEPSAPAKPADKSPT